MIGILLIAHTDVILVIIAGIVYGVIHIVGRYSK